MGLVGALLLVSLNTFCSVFAQEYIITNPADTQYIPHYHHQVDPYLPQRDLQTSHLPYHLQQTLPQYRGTTKAPPHFNYQPYSFQSAQPSPFQQIVPSTHRPNYSHLFSHSHNHNPSQSETFLGEITLQSPAEIPPFKQNLLFTEKPKFLNHRTRIFAPDANHKKETQVRDYFINNKGDVYVTTTTARPRNREENKGSDLEPLLEEPRKNDQKPASDDVVEVVKSVTTTEEPFTTDEYDYEATLANHEGKETNKVNGEEEEEYSEYEDYPEVTEEAVTEPPKTSTTPKTVKTQTTKKSTTKIVATTTEAPRTQKDSAGTAKSTTLGPSSTTVPPVTTVALNEENSTDSWVVIASVQTSRSVSGARYLPSSVVQDERLKLLNEEDVEDAETTTEESETTTKSKTSTESLIDKLDRVQSDLSSAVLTGGFKEEGNNIAVITEATSPTPGESSTKSALPQVNIRKFSPRLRSTTTPKPRKTFQRKTTPKAEEVPQNDEPSKDLNKTIAGLFEVIKKDDISVFLPPGYKASTSEPPPVQKNTQRTNTSSTTTEKPTTKRPIEKVLEIAKPVDISAFLPPGYKPTTESPKKVDKLLQAAKPVDISAFLPPGYKPSTEASRKEANKIQETSEKTVDKLLEEAKPVADISAFLPPGYKSSTTLKPPKKSREDLLSEAKPVEDISSLLPPGFKGGFVPKNAKSRPSDGYKSRTTTAKPLTTIAEDVPSSLLPPGFKYRKNSQPETTTHIVTISSTTVKPSSGGFKVVFPSRPGGGPGRKSGSRLTTPKTANAEEAKPTVPTIQKGWPSRATTEFTGWPTPSTTPISIEKLLEAARTSSSSTSEPSAATTSTSTTTTTTTTTTTVKPTTPGVCKHSCDLAGTIKLVGGAKWVPELLDRNTKEWQILANEVQELLENVFERSRPLKKWYKKIRIDGFSEGSVLVDYLVEIDDVEQVDTTEIKKLFHESLGEVQGREGKSLNETKISFGQFAVDPKYTDFVVLPKRSSPTVGYAEDNVLLPQWAIAVIVIGLASLLFVIIFGVTVLVNRQKNAKKKAPIPLTEDMLNELNKNHMGGFDNFGADDLYNMEDAWNDRGYEPKLPKKRSSGSIHDNSMSNLYDSWRSEWNGYYYNAYYGNNPGSSHGGGYGRRRSDYDTNF